MNIKSVIVLLLLACILAGCSLENGGQKKIILDYDNETDIATLDEQALSDDIDRLNCPSEILKNMSAVYVMDSLQAENIVGLVRYNNGRYYSVAKVEGGRYLFLLFESNGKEYYAADGILVSKLADKSLSDEIAAGMTKEEIVSKDPSAYFDTDYSYHRFNDKSIMKVHYIEENGAYVVSEFGFLDGQLSVLDYLTEEDFGKIS